MVVSGILSVILSASSILWCLFGTVIGIVFGAIPGLSATMAMVLFMPVSFGLEPVQACALLLGLYVGGISGGCISAILLKIPGTPASMCTVWDGGPMADRGEAGRALGISVLYSFIGGTLSGIALIYLSPLLAKVALQFSPYEYCSIALMSLIIIASLAGSSMINGLLSGLFGILVATIGVSPVGMVQRFTFGIRNLMSGISTIVLMIGLFAIAEVLNSAGSEQQKGSKVSYKIKGFGISLKEFVEQSWNALRSAVIGIIIGILPGLGANTSSVFAYSIARSSSKHPEKFGTGIIDGIIASESANNGNTGGALIPMLCLGVPGNTNAALLLATLTVQGISPGPLIFEKYGTLVYGIFTAFILANIMMLILEWRANRLFVKILDIPTYILYPFIIVLCMVGTFSDKNRTFDVTLAAVIGVLVYFLRKIGFAPTPFIIGFILTPILEKNLGYAISMSGGSLLPFITRPLSCTFLLVALLSALYVIYKNVRHEKNVLADDEN